MPVYQVNSPLVIVHNYLETFREFLVRDGNEAVLMDRKFNGDQAVFWQGNNKLIFTSAPIENIGLLAERWGYSAITSLAPQNPSSRLSLDIKNNQEMVDAIQSHLGQDREITLISYAASAELFTLVEYLEAELGIRVHLPETPDKKNLWLKHYIDSKVGFRVLVQKWVKEVYLPEGHIASNPHMIADIARYFALAGKGVAVKASIGGSGVGNLFFSAEEILAKDFEENIFAGEEITSDMICVVEEFIPSGSKISPSLEFFVPPIEGGSPVLTYLCNQHFEDSGRFAGVIIADEFYQAPWFPDFHQAGLKIAAELQKMGYVGHFDLDSILGDDGRLYLVEINSRRTGGTYVHEFMTRQFGQDYSSQYAVFSQNKVSTQFKQLAEVEDQIDDLLYLSGSSTSGVVLMLTSTLAKGKFGYLIIGKTVEEILAIRGKLLERL